MPRNAMPRNEEELPPDWEGPELAMQAVIDRLQIINKVLQPPRADIIYTNATEALQYMAQLVQWYESQPPGSFYYQSVHKKIPPTGGFPPEVLEQERLERQFERREQWTDQR